MCFFFHLFFFFFFSSTTKSWRRRIVVFARFLHKTSNAHVLAVFHLDSCFSMGGKIERAWLNELPTEESKRWIRRRRRRRRTSENTSQHFAFHCALCAWNCRSLEGFKWNSRTVPNSSWTFDATTATAAATAVFTLASQPFTRNLLQFRFHVICFRFWKKVKKKNKSLDSILMVCVSLWSTTFA